MLFKVLAQTLISDPFHRHLGCRTLTYFNNHHYKKEIQPISILAWRRISSSNSNTTSKGDSESDVEPVSLLAIKKQLKNANYEFTDGNCCLQTVCPACEQADGEINKNVYINKTTGM